MVAGPEAETAVATPAGEVTVYWDRLRASTWVALFQRCWRPSLLQSPAYNMALARSEPCRPRLGIVRLDGTTVAAVVAVERSALRRRLQAVTIHRGPAWLQADTSPDVQQAVLMGLRQSWPRRLGRRTAIMPELPAGEASRQAMRAAGFKRKRKPAYRTIFWALGTDSGSRWAALGQNWRNALRQARRRKIATEIDESGTDLTPLIQGYQQDKDARGYPGPSPAFAQKLGLTAAETGDLLIVRRLYRGETVAAGLFIRHGPAATYLAGWTTPEGRWRRANHAVLWQAGEHLADRGLAWLDLGGINPDKAPGVTFFKRGLGGQEIALAGTFT